MDDPKAAKHWTREIGRHDAGRDGPCVVVTGGIHGNEPAGCRAFGSVLEQIVSGSIPLRGRLIGLAGNLPALAEGRRYIDRDLNRRWSESELSRLLAAGPDGVREDREQLDLLGTLEPYLLESDRPVVFLDLHSTSGDTAPFACMADVLRNRPIAFALGLPVILGLEEVIDGSMLGYLCDLGHVGVAVEGGQHRDERTVAMHEAAIWVTLVAAGSVDASSVPDLPSHRARLARAAGGLPGVLEVRHRHRVLPDDDFNMKEGFTSFDPIARGQVVAWDRSGDVRAPEDGVMLMPRYQGQGDDGYFLARPVSKLWLRISALLRWLRADRLVPLLPGVRRDPERPDRFIVDRHVARFRVVDIFHLLGYRRVREAGDTLVFSRRRPDFRPVRPPAARRS